LHFTLITDWRALAVSRWNTGVVTNRRGTIITNRRAAAIPRTISGWATGAFLANWRTITAGEARRILFIFGAGRATGRQAGRAIATRGTILTIYRGSVFLFSKWWRHRSIRW
jgi:hypothetical protein